MKPFLLILLLLVGISAEVPTLSYSVIRSIPHDRDAFTQGLLLIDGYLWESTGTPGGGTRIRQIDTETGDVVRSSERDNSFFGEGLSCDGINLYQLSWQQQRLHVFTYPSLDPVETISYSGEGWGLAKNDKKHFLMSNGSDTIVERNLEFGIVRRIPVSLNGKPLKRLNELEWFENRLYANVWMDDFIAVIDPESGKVTHTIDLSRLREECGASGDDRQVVNGIAAAGRNRFWVTGKLWSKLFLIEIQ